MWADACTSACNIKQSINPELAKTETDCVNATEDCTMATICVSDLPASTDARPDVSDAGSAGDRPDGAADTGAAFGQRSFWRKMGLGRQVNYGGRMVDDMMRLVSLFAPLCAERRTMDELAWMLADHEHWAKAHDLFDRIRRKTLVADRDRNDALIAQYCFEEICAKTLYNLTDTHAPFDEDSPYWIVPNAFALARALKVDYSRVLEIVAA